MWEGGTGDARDISEVVNREQGGGGEGCGG